MKGLIPVLAPQSEHPLMRDKSSLLLEQTAFWVVLMSANDPKRILVQRQWDQQQLFGPARAILIWVNDC
jgi:hypothetical protein